MYRPKFLFVVVLSLSFSVLSRAQIFINTGNPHIEKYMKEDPNAVLWDGGKNIPVPKNIPAESKPATPAPQQNEPAQPTYTNTSNNNTPVTSTAVQSTPGFSFPKKEPVPDYPPNAVPGHCYARCVIPDQFEFKEEQQIEKPASFSIERVPARYETVYDTVVAIPEGKKTISIPAQYETITEDRMVSPATQKWVKMVNSKTCLSPNPKDCETWVLKDMPAVFEKVSRKVEVVPPSTREEIIPAVMKVVPRKKIIEPAREIRTDIPPTYKTVTKKVLLKKGGGYEWKEIICEQNLTDSKIFSIQQALVREGYDPGEIDNQMGGKTKEALIKFQQDKGLSVGSLTMETLRALGIE